MPDTIEQRVSRLEIDAARGQEQYAQIIKMLHEMSGQLQAFNSTFVRRDLCEQSHKAYDREQYEFRHTIEKRIVESDAILAGEIQKIEKRLTDAILALDEKQTKANDGVGARITAISNRVWGIFVPVIVAFIVYIVQYHLGGGK